MLQVGTPLLPLPLSCKRFTQNREFFLELLQRRHPEVADYKMREVNGELIVTITQVRDTRTNAPATY